MGIKVGTGNSLQRLIYLEGLALAGLFSFGAWVEPFGFGLEGPVGTLFTQIGGFHEAVRLGLAAAVFGIFVGLMLYVPAVFWTVATALSLLAAYLARDFYLSHYGQDMVWAAAVALLAGGIVLFLHWRARADAIAPGVDILRNP